MLQPIALSPPSSHNRTRRGPLRPQAPRRNREGASSSDELWPRRVGSLTAFEVVLPRCSWYLRGTRHRVRSLRHRRAESLSSLARERELVHFHTLQASFADQPAQSHQWPCAPCVSRAESTKFVVCRPKGSDQARVESGDRECSSPKYSSFTKSDDYQ